VSTTPRGSSPLQRWQHRHRHVPAGVSTTRRGSSPLQPRGGDEHDGLVEVSTTPRGSSPLQPGVSPAGLRVAPVSTTLRGRLRCSRGAGVERSTQDGDGGVVIAIDGERESAAGVFGAVCLVPGGTVTMFASDPRRLVRCGGQDCSGVAAVESSGSVMRKLSSSCVTRSAATSGARPAAQCDTASTNP
jgi:hypothetical protein